MVLIKIQLNLPHDVAHGAEAQGLLHAEAIESLVRAELRRRQIDQLFDAADSLAAHPEPLVTRNAVHVQIVAETNTTETAR
jgi:hypothetical protein